MYLLSIIIPLYNAEKTIHELCSRLLSLYSDRCRMEIILVNDSSSDNTDAECRKLTSKYPETLVYSRLSRNFGEHKAVMAGLNQSRGDYVVIMDDDFQNPPEEVAKLLDGIEKGYDVVYSQYEEKNDSLFRNLGSYLNGSMARVILHKPENLYLSSFKVMNRFLVDEIIRFTTPNPYIDAIILRITKNIGTVFIRHDERKHGRSGYTIRKLVALWGDMVVSYSLVPLRVMAVLGFILTLLGTYSVVEMFVRDFHPDLASLTDLEELSSITMFFRGLQLFATGIVGEYVGRIFLRLNQEPQFIIRERIDSRRKEPGVE